MNKDCCVLNLRFLFVKYCWLRTFIFKLCAKKGIIDRSDSKIP